MSTPQISVLLPVRDAQATLPEALASLQCQTYADFEVLLHDDGSEDDSLALAQAAARDDARISVVAGAPQGIVAALNACAARARAPWLARMDADDVSAPQRFARLLDAAEARPEVTFWASGVRYFPRHDLSNGMRRYETWINALTDPDDIARDQFVECPMPHPAWMLRRELFEALGGYRAGDFPEDYEFVLRALEHGARLQKVPDTLLLWRDHAQRVSRTDPRCSLERFRDRKVASLLPRLDGRPVSVIGAGRDGKRWARRLRDQGVRVVAFYDTHARRIGQQIDRIPVHAAADTPAPGGEVLLVAVGRGRAAVRDDLLGRGHRELDTFYCVQ